MEAEDLEIIFGKEYRILSSDEKSQIAEFCSNEDEFNQVKHFFSAVENYASRSEDYEFPRESVKADLDRLFYETHQSKSILWYNSVWLLLVAPEKKFHQKPLIRIAAILVVVFSIVPFVFHQPKSPTLVAKLEPIQTEKSISTNDDHVANTSVSAKTEVASKEPQKRKQVVIHDLESNSRSENEIAAASANSLDETNFVNVPPMASFSSSPTVCSSTASTELNATTFTSGSTYKWTVHPDGIYDQKKLEEATNSKQVETRYALLDILTPTF